MRENRSAGRWNIFQSRSRRSKWEGGWRRGPRWPPSWSQTPGRRRPTSTSAAQRGRCLSSPHRGPGQPSYSRQPSKLAGELSASLRGRLQLRTSLVPCTGHLYVISLLPVISGPTFTYFGKKIIAYARKLSRVNMCFSLHRLTYIENILKYIKYENGAVSRSNPIGDLEIEFYFYPLHLIHWSISSLHLILNAQDKQTFYIIWKFSPIYFLQMSPVHYMRLFFLSEIVK